MAPATAALGSVGWASVVALAALFRSLSTSLPIGVDMVSLGAATRRRWVGVDEEVITAPTPAAPITTAAVAASGANDLMLVNERSRMGCSTSEVNTAAIGTLSATTIRPRTVGEVSGAEEPSQMWIGQWTR